jgi:uncharacterized membrane protein
MNAKVQAVLLAAIAGLVGAAGQLSAHGEGAAGETVPCYGINKCKGTGDCGGKGHSCHGQNACKAQGYIDISKEDCLRIEGGRLTEEPEAAS